MILPPISTLVRLPRSKRASISTEATSRNETQDLRDLSAVLNEGDEGAEDDGDVLHLDRDMLRTKMTPLGSPIGSPRKGSLAQSSLSQQLSSGLASNPVQIIHGTFIPSKKSRKKLRRKLRLSGLTTPRTGCSGDEQSPPRPESAPANPYRLMQCDRAASEPAMRNPPSAKI